MQFSGEFKPPAFGVDKVPVPLTGKGNIEISDSGIRFNGAKRSPLTGCLYFLGFIGALVGASALAVQAGVDFPPEVIIYPAFGALIYFGLKRGGGSGKPWSFDVEWSQMRLTGAVNGAVELHVHNGKPKGMIYFYPEKHQDAVNEIKGRLGQ